MRGAICVASIFLIAASPALAQSQDSDVIYKQVTEIDMGGVNVSATIVGPDGALINQRPKPQFNPMIKLRKDFDSEMERSVDEVR
jgi:hypothetical protein